MTPPHDTSALATPPTGTRADVWYKGVPTHIPSRKDTTP